MAKKHRRRKANPKVWEFAFYGLLGAAAILIVVLVIMTNQPVSGGYTISADGHVHDAAGAHVGDFDEMVANGSLVVTADGHVHDAAGNHVGDVSSIFGTEATAVTEPDAAAESESAAEAE